MSLTNESTSSDPLTSHRSYEVPEAQVQWAELEKVWATHKEDDFINQVLRGRDGLNVGLDNGLGNINTYIHGTHQGRIYLVGADSGVGKTTLADFMWIYKHWIACRKRKITLYIKYFSFELSAAEKKARWCSQWIKHYYGQDIPSDYIMGRIDGLRVSDEHLRMIMRAHAVVEEVMSDMVIIDHMLHPTGMLNVIIEQHYEKIGTVHRVQLNPYAGETVADFNDRQKVAMITGFTADDPSARTLIMVDHLALINHETGLTTTKAIMDRWSMYAVQIRNLFRATIIHVQQFNTNQMTTYRETKKSASIIAPQRLDFGDSTYTYRDADVVIGLVNPVMHDIRKFYDWDLSELGLYFIALYLMKNRYGPASRMFPLFLNPISGMFYDFPMDPKENLSYYYQETKRIEALCQTFSSPQGTNR